MRAITHSIVQAALLALLLGVSPAAAPAQTASGQPVIADKSAAGELAFWNSIKNSSNAADFKTYMDNFPNGMFFDQAMERFKKAGGNPAGMMVHAPASAAVTKAPPTTIAATVTNKASRKVAAKSAYRPIKKNIYKAKAKHFATTATPARLKKTSKLVCRSGVIHNGVCIKAPVKKVVQYNPSPLLGAGSKGGGGAGGGGGGGGSGGGWGN